MNVADPGNRGRSVASGARRERGEVGAGLLDRFGAGLAFLMFVERAVDAGQAGVAEFLKENLVFTGEDSPLANLMLSVMGAFAEFERALIGEHQREGIAQAKKRGAYRGRKKALSTVQAVELAERAAAGEPKAALAREYGISRETVYQYIRPKR